MHKAHTIQMRSYTMQQYQDAGCPNIRVLGSNKPTPDSLLKNLAVKIDDTLEAVHKMTGGRMCTTGCFTFNNGKCASFQRLENGAAAKAAVAPSETVREMAARLNISLSEARRQRAAS